MKKNYINGHWQAAIDGHTHQLLNPATEEVIEVLPLGNKNDILAAIAAAETAFESYKHTTPYFRATILKKAADIIRHNVDAYAKDMVLESGKPLAEAKGELQVAANLFEWFAEEGKRSYGRVIPSSRANKRMQVVYQPLGVVAAITAWNFPAYNPARCWAAILAAGCTLVARGSEHTPLTCINLMQALHEAGLPAGVANLVNSKSSEAGQLFLDHPAIKKISFTGSTRVGKLLMDGASKTNTRLALELGGNAAVIIAEDVHIPTVAAGAVASKFRNAGQVCIAPQRFYVHQSIYNSFVEAVIASIKTIKMGNGLEEAVQMGPLINQKQQQHVLQFIAKAHEEGAKVTVGGEANTAKGYFITPCLIEALQTQSFLHEEVFGPVMIVVPYENDQQALQWANDTPYGLAAYVFTSSLQKSIYFSEGLEAGMIGINEWLPQATEAPFGGWKESGIGHEAGSEGLLEYLDKKLISTGGLQ
jgi:acyl-CoA reductase-like NAD-dependent aldehyde dehydrogenase